MGRARSAIFILLCVFTLSLPGCATGPGFGKAESDQPPKEIKRPAATETKPANGAKPAKKPQPSEDSSAPSALTKPAKKPPALENSSAPPALTKPAKKPPAPEVEDLEAPPLPSKPPAIGGSGG